MVSHKNVRLVSGDPTYFVLDGCKMRNYRTNLGYLDSQGWIDRCSKMHLLEPWCSEICR